MRSFSQILKNIASIKSESKQINESFNQTSPDQQEKFIQAVASKIHAKYEANSGREREIEARHIIYGAGGLLAFPATLGAVVLTGATTIGTGGLALAAAGVAVGAASILKSIYHKHKADKESTAAHTAKFHSTEYSQYGNYEGSRSIRSFKDSGRGVVDYYSRRFGLSNSAMKEIMSEYKGILDGTMKEAPKTEVAQPKVERSYNTGLATSANQVLADLRSIVMPDEKEKQDNSQSSQVSPS